MKWIGQHIWDFISRFRSDVYLENLNSGSVASGDHLGVDSDGKIVKTTGGGSGGSLTIVDNDTTTTFNNTTTVTIQGDEVQSFQNGANNVLLNIGSSISTAGPFSISTDPVVATSSDFSNLRVGKPHSTRNFFAGNWSTSGSTLRLCTKASTITFGPSNQAGNMENSSKIIVDVEGPKDNTSGGSGTILATHTHTVTGNGNSTLNGITITISNYVLDGYGDKRKANVTVTINPGTIATNVATAENLANHTGSQKFYQVKISHKSNDLSDSYGAFTSASFFYDGALVQPVGTDATISLDSSSTKYLSNIKYYSALQWSVDGSNIQHIARDTRTNTDIRVDFTDDITTTKHGTAELPRQYLALTGNDDNSVIDDTNEYETTWVLDSDKYELNLAVHGRLAYIYGGLAAAGVATNLANDSARMMNTYSGNSSSLTENFREEDHRLPENTISTWNTNSVSQALNTWQGYSVSGSMGNAGVTINNAHDTTKNLLLQVQHSGSTFKLIHPYNFDQLTTASLPTQDKYDGDAISQSANVKYYRWFRFSSAVNTFDCDITGMTRSSYDYNENLGRINIRFSRPGVNNTFVPLDPDQGFQSGSPDVSCYDASNGYSSGTPGYNSDLNVFKCVFGTASILYVMEITMNGHFSNNITQIQLST